MRINARLDEAQTKKLEDLCRRTGQSRTGVLKTAIECYHAEVTNMPHRAAEILRKNGFIGCGDDDPELSRDYKQRLTSSVTAKHDHR